MFARAHMCLVYFAVSPRPVVLSLTDINFPDGRDIRGNTFSPRLHVVTVDGYFE